MDTYIIIVIIFGIIALILISLLFFINRLSILSNKIEFAFKPIKTYIEERNDILDKMKEFITNNLEHEEEFLKEIDKAKETLETTRKAIEGIPNLKKTEKVFIKFNKLDEIYPKLKNNKEYKTLTESYNNNQDRINYGINNYDEGVKKYNNYKEKKIVSTLSILFHFPNYIYYKNESWYLQLMKKNMK